MTPRIQDRARLAGGADNRWEVVARRYRDRLSVLIEALGLGDEPGGALQVGQLFNGAALHADGVLCATWSPVGLAFRLPPAEVAHLIRCGHALPLKYFAKGEIRKDWALFEDSELEPDAELKGYFLRAIAQADGHVST